MHGVQGSRGAEARSAGRAVDAGKHCMTGVRGTIHFCGLSRTGDTHARPFARSPSRRACALAGAPGASAQTGLTMSSWVPPTHSLTRDVLVAWSKRSRRRPAAGSSSRCCQASVGASGNVRCGARRPRRRLLRDRQLHAGAPSAAADGRAARRRCDRRDQLDRVLARPLEVLPAGQRIQGRQAARRVHARARADVPGQEAGDSVADLAGIKIRSGGGISEASAKALGASPFVKPAPESYELLSSGVADGTFFPSESIVSFKLDKVVKYATFFPGGFYSSRSASS